MVKYIDTMLCQTSKQTKGAMLCLIKNLKKEIEMQKCIFELRCLTMTKLLSVGNHHEPPFDRGVKLI